MACQQSRGRRIAPLWRERKGWPDYSAESVYNVGCLYIVPAFHDTEQLMEEKTFTTRKSLQPWESSLALSGLQRILHV